MSNNIVPVSSGGGGEEARRVQKPLNSAFKQQKLSAWQPILTVGTVLPTFFLIGVAFIPVGIGLLISSYQVHEYEFDYTSCLRQNAPISSNQSAAPVTCSQYIAQRVVSSAGQCICHVNITISEDIKRDVFLYYGLTNFYQNHRRYVKSRDDYQLMGHLRASKECDPYAYREDIDGVKKIIVPCGAIANSLFNDTFVLERVQQRPPLASSSSSAAHQRQSSTPVTYLQVPTTSIGIAWATDKRNKFRNPGGATNLTSAFNGTMMPFNWKKPIYELDTKDPSDNGLQNEGLIVWMRTAAFPTFRKLYARIAHDKVDNTGVDYHDSLPKGEYRLTIQYNFPVAEFEGKKRFIISNTSWLGGKNPFIGAVYIFVGIIALILTAVFFVIHKKFRYNTDNFNITTQTTFLANS